MDFESNKTMACCDGEHDICIAKYDCVCKCHTPLNMEGKPHD